MYKYCWEEYINMNIDNTDDSSYELNESQFDKMIIKEKII